MLILTFIHLMETANKLHCESKNKNLATANRRRVSCAHNVESISVTLKSRLRVTQGHWKWNQWVDHTRLTISRVI